MTNTYAIAGEVFGHLQDCIGFGEIAMLRPPREREAQPVIIYRWEFKANGQWHSCEMSIAFDELASLTSAKPLAEYIAAMLRANARTTATPPVQGKP